MHHNYIQQAAYQSSVSGTKLLERSIPLQAEITNLQTLQQNRTDVVITYTVHEAIAKRGFKSDKKFYKNFDFHNMTVHALLCISYNLYWLTISLKWYFINATLGRGRYKVYNNISEEDIHNLVNIGITISVLISQQDSDWHEPLHWYFTRSYSTSSNNSQFTICHTLKHKYRTLHSKKKKFTSPRIPKLKKTTDLIPTEFETYDESYTRGFNIWLSCFKYKTRKNPINLLLHVTWHQHLLNISSTVWGRRESMSSWWWSFNKIKL